MAVKSPFVFKDCFITKLMNNTAQKTENVQLMLLICLLKTRKCVFTKNDHISFPHCSDFMMLFLFTLSLLWQDD